MERAIDEPRLMTIDEYLEFEAQSDEKHEYHSGEIVSMAGGSPMHALMATNLGSEIRSHLKGKNCRVFSSDLRVRIPNHPTYVYPDLTVVCGPLELDSRDKSRHSIVNPKLVIEVMSPTSAARDWAQKTIRYVSVPTVEEYVLISQSEPQVFSIFGDSDGGWRFAPLSGLDQVLKLRSLEIEIAMTEIYAGVEFPPQPGQME